MRSLFLLAVVAIFFEETKEQYTIETVVLRFPNCWNWNNVALRDCQDILSKVTTVENGRYNICPGGGDFGQSFDAWCDMEGGGWTVLLKRFNGSVDFNLNWDQMKHLVGDVDGEYWLGLENIHRLATTGDYSMMVEIREGSRTWTEIYDNFTLSNEAKNYTFRVEGFDSTNSNNIDALALQNDIPFSTRNRENTGQHCTSVWEGPNWFNRACSVYIHPFGPYPLSDSYAGPRMQWRVNGRDINPTELIWKIKRRGP